MTPLRRKSHALAEAKRRLRTTSRLPAVVRKVVSKTVGEIWSLRGAVAIAVAALIFSFIDLYLAVRGKLVILPFEVRAENSLGQDVGSSFAASLAFTLNDYRTFYPPNERSKARSSSNQNSFDIIQSFLADLPFINIPRTSPLNKGSTAIDSVKVGPLSIPVRQVAIEYLGIVHKDLVRGSLEAWGNEIKARVTVGDDEDIVVSVTKEQGFKRLIDRLAVELIRKRQWITPVPMNASALLSFSEGLKNYRDYDTHGEQAFLERARIKYSEAVDADRQADLARLHLASAQYVSWDTATLRRAVENFSILRGSEQFRAHGRIGYVAAILRYMERTRGCDTKYEFLEHVLNEVRLWGSHADILSSLGFEGLVLRASSFHQASGHLLINSQCSDNLKNRFPNQKVEEYFALAEESYSAALSRIESANWSEDQKKRYSLYIRLKQKYLSNDRTDHSIITRKQDAIQIATHSIQLGLSLEADKSSLSERQKRAFAPYLGGSIAESFFRLAKLHSGNAPIEKEFVDKAREYLRITVGSGDSGAARWAMLRLADLEMSRGHYREGLGWLNLFFIEIKVPTSMFAVIDEHAFASAAFLEKKSLRCKAIDLLKKAGDSMFATLFLVDAIRRSGDRQSAQELFDETHKTFSRSTHWAGEALRVKMDFVKAKLSGITADRAELAKLLEKTSQRDFSGPFFALDKLELISMFAGKNALTQPEVVLDLNLLPSVRADDFTGPGTCTQRDD